MKTTLQVLHMLFQRVAVALLLIAVANPASAQKQDSATASWQLRADVYVWAAGVGGESATGGDIDIEFTDLARDLELGFMGTFAAERDRWIIASDLIYLDVEDDDGIDVSAEVELKTVELSGWIFNPFAGYRLLESGESYLAVIAGARYLDLQLDIDVRSRPPDPPQQLSESYSEDFWDGIVGVIGRVQLSDRWAIPYYLDIGTGDSDTTWQAYAGVAYSLESFELLAGYRHLEWDFDSDDPAFNDLNLAGPMIGARWRF